MRRVRALGGAKDTVADFKPLRCLRSGEDSSCELGAADPRQWRLVLVLALNLEEVEEVGARGVDFNQVMIRRGGGCREVCDREVKRALLVVSSQYVSSELEPSATHLDIFPNLQSSHCVLFRDWDHHGQSNDRETHFLFPANGAQIPLT